MCCSCFCCRCYAFQSTPPARGATGLLDGNARENLDFNPRPPRGGRHPPNISIVPHPLISIHAPREGGDLSTGMTPKPTIFQSTPPARGATVVFCNVRIGFFISIHAPREGGDRKMGRLPNTATWISIHAPREGGDRIKTDTREISRISIHAPREGGDYSASKRSSVL